MKRLLALFLLAFTFAFPAFAVSDSETTPTKPEAAMDALLKGSKDTVDSEKSEAKKKSKASKSKRKSKKKKEPTIVQAPTKAGQAKSAEEQEDTSEKM